MALLISMALAAMDTTIVATAIPQIVDSLGGFSLMGWIFSAYLLAQTVTIPIYGKLADIYGRKPLLVGGILIFLIGSILCATATSMVSMIVYRAVQGLGAGSINATVNTVAGDLYDVRDRGRVQGILSSVWGIAAIAGPALGGVLVTYATWRWIFFINIPIGGFALVLIMRMLGEQRRKDRRDIDFAGALVILLFCGLLIFGLLQGGVSWAWTSPVSIMIFAGSILFAVIGLLWERRATSAIMPPWLWRNRLILGSFVATIFAGLLIMGFAAFLPTWLEGVLGVSALGSGAVLALMSVVWPIATGFSNRLYMRIGFRYTAMIGGVFAAISGLLLVVSGSNSGILRPAFAAIAMGIGLGLIASVLLVGVQSAVTWSQRGVATGAMMFSRYLGQSIGTAVFGAVANSILAHRIGGSPPQIRAELPQDVNDVSGRLRESGGMSEIAHRYLLDSLHLSMHGVFWGVLISAGAVILVLFIVPRKVDIVESEASA